MTVPDRPEVHQRFTLSMCSDYVSHWTFWAGEVTDPEA